ncbi:2-polyprenylphenol 6-hydroxylase [Rhizorhabdus dicambivorans]|uniref:2-polyprenylphenol 6-hydroxylase n=1 Tax=Rhizorhabdus dicambivorans TaxID=1850238 RepID=A0A2A4G293_9SPHN|nr:2-polyprenylphenol 6-hydroxylase [Rhizorhabdus dicambivorans]ATE64864.1 2-polyprenylphenol 6-hydroxylase [Rhizorhabdus dicambivorans]PCE44138.1 2-polyprenylphenol 6-hydroxylase [Rhizorhabdus dicambivorans]
MTPSFVHLWRLARWGRTLARHGALRGIERDVLTPPTIRRFVRLLRFGARLPDQPAYADAFEALGPAAIKLGQALATRPDLVGEQAAAELFRLQDALPPAPFPAIRATIEQSLEKPIGEIFASIEEEPVGAASVAQVHRAVTTDGRTVAVKVLRPGIEEELARAIETYEWAAAHAELMGGELSRLRPRLVIATFKQWTARELDLRREAASASELAENMAAVPGFVVPAIDWSRTARRVMTMEWIDGVKMADRAAIAEAGHDSKALAALLVQAFLRQAIADGFFHADLHQGNLFALPDGRIAAIDFGIMGRIDRRARLWLAEILHGLITGNYRRVAEIHFEAGYVPPHHNLGEFTTALRAVGEPIRGLPAKDISIGQMLDGLFAITRDFDMQTQPHLLLLQKTMVMVEGVAAGLNPDLNMWETSGPFVKEWLRSELGPEAWLADRIVDDLRTIARLPDLVRRIEAQFPAPGAAPPPPPLPEVALIRINSGWRYAAVAVLAAAAGIAAALLLN